VLTVKNTDTATNQLARVSVSSSGMSLSRTASGVTSESTLAFATYTTLSALATAINALGNGWTATVAGDSNDYGKWPTAYLKYIQGSLNARDNPAEIEMYVDDLSRYRLVTNDDSAYVYGAFPRGVQNIEVRYSSGYATIPDAVKMGVLDI